MSHVNTCVDNKSLQLKCLLKHWKALPERQNFKMCRNVKMCWQILWNCEENECQIDAILKTTKNMQRRMSNVPNVTSVDYWKGFWKQLENMMTTAWWWTMNLIILKILLIDLKLVWTLKIVMAKRVWFLFVNWKIRTLKFWKFYSLL